MKEVLLDTNFILSCIRNKIDFFEELNLMGFKILIPKQVVFELASILDSKKKLKFKEEASLALQLLKNNSFKEVDLGVSYVDEGIRKFSKNNKDVIVATLDKELKDELMNSKLVIRNKKSLEVI